MGKVTSFVLGRMTLWISEMLKQLAIVDNVETCVTSSVYLVYKVDSPFSFYCSYVLHCDAAIVLLVLSDMFGNKK